MNRLVRALAAAVMLLVSSAAWATPSTTYWAPSTLYSQPYLVPHITYDTYFRGSSSYPATYGLTIGVLPYDALQAEVGFDLLYPTNDPLFLNAKLTLVEDKLFANQPGFFVGVANAGITAATDLAMVYSMVGKTIMGTSLAVGGYYGLNGNRWVSSSGTKEQVGVLASISAPPIKINQPFLDSIVLVADVQTGDNAFGAGGPGVYFYFTPTVDLLTGPVFFFDKGSQPGQSSWLWTVQLDIDMPGIPALLKGKQPDKK